MANLLKSVFGSSGKKKSRRFVEPGQSLKGDAALEQAWALDVANKRKGTWWWWFWLFFFENPKNPSKPRQLMVLWSTKNDKEINCNGRQITLRKEPAKTSGKKAFLDGVVASWYFDGNKMHDDFFLQHSDITVDKSKKEVKTENAITCQKGSVLKTILKKGSLSMEFNARLLRESDSAQPVMRSKRFFGGKYDYRIIKINKLDLTCLIKQGRKVEKARGSAYFQKVTVNAPVMPWYWSIVHLEDGGVLSYFYPHVGVSLLEDNLFKGVATQQFLQKVNKSLSKELVYYDPSCKSVHFFRKLKVRAATNKQGLPLWHVRAKNEAGEKIDLKLNSYAKSFWKFRKKVGRLPLKSTLYYNEYPVRLTSFEFYSKNKRKTLKDTGGGVGNAEHAWGFLY
ncbi:MAG: hypothetical protein ACE5DI_05515 [Candidatus Micrarchaeia archaeon]